MSTDSKPVPCDLCGSGDAVEVPHARKYTNGQPIHICTGCGFVYVRERRTPQAIADSWSEDIFGSGYTAAIPAVIARLTYVAEFLHQTIGLEGKQVVEVGAGEGYFLDMVRQPRYGADVFGVEPSKANCRRMQGLGIPVHHGTVEDFVASGQATKVQADVVAVMWTLENCHSCVDMLKAAYAMLRPGGHVLVATGSRLLVPFKKPLHDYLSRNPADTHSFRFSANTLRGALTVAGFDIAEVNRYHDSDYLCVIGRKGDKPPEADSWTCDDYLDVHNFFERWHVDTQMYHRPRAL